jgi:hypothetical protein
VTFGRSYRDSFKGDFRTTVMEGDEVAHLKEEGFMAQMRRHAGFF